MKKSLVTKTISWSNLVDLWLSVIMVKFSFWVWTCHSKNFSGIIIMYYFNKLMYWTIISRWKHILSQVFGKANSLLFYFPILFYFFFFQEKQIGFGWGLFVCLLVCLWFVFFFLILKFLQNLALKFFHTFWSAATPMAYIENNMKE